MLRFVTLFALLTFALSQPCGHMCRFRMCKPATGELRSALPNVLIRPPGEYTLSAYVCRPDVNLGQVLNTGEARINGTIPLSHWNPHGLSYKFDPDFFYLGRVEYRPALQGIARKPTRANQRLFLDNLCVTLPVKEWNVLNKDGTVMRRETGGPDDCVAFKTVYPEVLVEMQWDSTDDLELSVIEPDGTKLDAVNNVTEAGRLNNGKGRPRPPCNSDALGRESAIYDADNREAIQKGVYEFKVRVKSSCNTGQASWMLRVMVRDRVVVVRRGVAEMKKDEVITRGGVQV